MNAEQIYSNVLDAMQDAEEIEGPEGQDYIALMEWIAAECRTRIETARADLATQEAYEAGAEYARQVASDMSAHQHGPNRMTEFHDLPEPDERVLRAKYPDCEAVIDKAFRRGYNEASAQWYDEHSTEPKDDTK